MDHATIFLTSARHQFNYYKQLGEKAMAQVDDAQLLKRTDDQANSIAIIVQHLHGNMRSRWTDFLTTDGEKEWRERDLEFEDVISDRATLMGRWESGWQCVFDALDTISPTNFDTTVYIRAQAHTITDAVNRQLCHYAYHVGQMVFFARMLKGPTWQSLSIPRGNSGTFNQEKFARGEHGGHFTEDLR